VKSRLLLLAIPVLAACGDWTDDIAGPSMANMPGEASAAVQEGIADRYIVVFRDDVQDPAALADALAAQAGATIHFRYAHALKGFAATIPALAVQGITRNPNVAFIEADGIATTTTTTDNTVSSWGLDRIDQHNLPLSSSYSWNEDGSGVRAYIIDTGIRTSHSDFGGRASIGYDALGGTGQDCNGHGTHVAGTVGGTEYGVARKVTLVAVRVLNCAGSGTWSQVIAGINWVAGNPARPAVANMSLGGGFSLAVNAAVRNAVQSGITFAVAAGNSNANACNYSPASTAEALTVGATTSSDARAYYSNYGSCVDIFAPGSGIKSAWSTGDNVTNTISGTSMASPHVAGAAALYLDANSNASPSQVASALKNTATTGKVTSPGSGSPNLLLYTLGGSEPIPPPPSGFVLTANGYKVKGVQKADLSWTGATATIDIYRNGVKIVAGTANDGVHTDNINVRGGGTYSYQVCHANTSTCSSLAVVTF
jgi:hypothetical protein